jgi:hypothetical protein
MAAPERPARHPGANWSRAPGPPLASPVEHAWLNPIAAAEQRRCIRPQVACSIGLRGGMVLTAAREGLAGLRVAIAKCVLGNAAAVDPIPDV